MGYQLIQGSAHSLPQIPDKSVHLVATSPPYFGLRAYSGDQAIEWSTVEYSPMAGLAPIRVQGCEPGCVHEWSDIPPVYQRGTVGNKSTLDSNQNRGRQQAANQGAYCIHCGGWRGGLGLEPTIESFIGHLILCLREWHRILRDDGLVFVNLGDSYNGSGSIGNMNGKQGTNKGSIDKQPTRVKGLKPKDLMMVPSRFALAAQAEGWTLRSRPPWLKRNSMPESVGDRPSTSHEEWFMLAKNENYFWDIEAIRIPHAMTSWTAVKEASGQLARGKQGIRSGEKGAARANGAADGQEYGKTSFVNGGYTQTGRNRRTGDWYFESLDIAIDETETWLNHAKQTRKHGGLLLGIDGNPAAFLVNPHPYKSAHFATFPQKMIEPIIRAGTSQHGVCAKCGSPWRRVVERTITGRGETASKLEDGIHERSSAKSMSQKRQAYRAMGLESPPAPVTTGWIPSCACYGVPIPARLDFPDQSEDAIEPSRCDECDGIGHIDTLPMLAALGIEQDRLCETCLGTGHIAANDAWLLWRAECDQIQRDRLRLLDSIKGLNLPVTSATVLDPFSGSGTTGKACLKLGRKYIGVDISEQYLTELAPERMSNVQMELAL